ncbi:MAG: hypothetical protein IMZ62_12925 [Chloroflexi bacterium]|nr:hypothetical protein [Chloroflexota bacterium]MBE3119107.1 hypothetical protein [Candidatus Atribacteria bacterium]
MTKPTPAQLRLLKALAEPGAYLDWLGDRWELRPGTTPINLRTVDACACFGRGWIVRKRICPGSWDGYVIAKEGRAALELKKKP